KYLFDERFILEDEAAAAVHKSIAMVARWARAIITPLIVYACLAFLVAATITSTAAHIFRWI
ncbi:hypothetical protein CCACVL1_11088, partial [Corchorus capsularis]